MRIEQGIQPVCARKGEPMEYLHKEFDLAEGDIVEVTRREANPLRSLRKRAPDHSGDQ
jgi:hypothetical protein